MPTPLKIVENQKKHLTKAERVAREQAETGQARATRTTIKCPDWLGEEARKIFESTKRKLKGLQLLDNADAELLAVYCDAMAKYQAASKLLAKVDEAEKPIAGDDDIKACQAWARLIGSLGEKLGLTPTARARLARKKALGAARESGVPEGSYSLEDMEYFQDIGHWPWEEEA